MELAEVIKKQTFFKDLVRKKEQNILSNAILFFCEDEATSSVILTLCALLIEYPTFDLLNEKSGEYLRASSGNDLDIKCYPKGERIVVADSNEIVSEAFVKPVNLPYKIFMLNQFDNATEEAQNKLLKTLEEPPKNVYFLIATQNEGKILPTIKSRCEKIKVNPFSQEEISQFCHDELACILGGGFIGKTKAYADRNDLKMLVDFAVSIITQMKTSKQVLEFSSKFLDYKSETELILKVLSLAVEDIMKLKCESENLCSLHPYKAELEDVEGEFSVRALCEISKLITSLREKMEFNANFSVAIDNFLLKILEVKYLCK